MNRRASFQSRVIEAVEDDRLRLAVLHATTQRDEKRRDAWRELPDADALRELARQIKDHTLARLDTYLLSLIEQFQRLGIVVHLASTAAEANEEVRTILREHACTRIVKSKSMLTEELHLNESLEQHGFEILETDLGEYLLQLDHDRPSHITAPAVHKDVASCARTFAKHLDTPYVEDPQQLVQIARRALRDSYRNADAAVTGVNFAVAESGTIILVMNEGNGRFCVLRPRVHIAVMGIEKILPTLRDAAVMLKLLGRSATSQKLTVDTHFITGPKRADESEGPQHMHVVIVDSGRSELLAGKYRDVLRCIRCGACLNICPVYRSIGGHAYGGTYPGPIGKLLTQPLEHTRDGHELPHASSLCGACFEACPVKIDIPHLLIEMRHDQATSARAGKRLRGLKWMMWFLRSRKRFEFAQRMAKRFLRSRAHDDWIDRAPGPLAGWTRAARDLPAPPRKSFRDLWREGKI